MLTPLNDTDPTAIGPYRLQSRIGAGGMGVVYLGFGPAGQAVAIKVPVPSLASDPDFRARFRREVAAARAVRGSRVAAVLDADTDSARPWMATEYVEGTSLAQAVTARGPLDERLLAGLAAGLADALVAVHAAGLVHRDLKPANILLAWDGPKVIDFGIASSEEATRHTRTGILIGTLVWMAPEQLRGERADTPADIFAWGACVAFAATGRPPFRGDRPEAAAIKIMNGEPDLGGVPADLLGVVRDALSKDPAHRPTATGIVARLAGRDGGTGATAVPVTTVAESDRVANNLLEQWRGSAAVPSPPAGWSAPPDGWSAPPDGRNAPPAGWNSPPGGWNSPPGGWAGQSGAGHQPADTAPRRRVPAALAVPALLVLLVGVVAAVTVLVMQARDPATVPAGAETPATPPGGATATLASPGGTAGGALPPPATRTPPTSAVGLTREDAETMVAGKGYAVVDSSSFSEDKLLNVIVAVARDVTGTSAQRAFIFAEGAFLGYDTKDPSAMITIRSSTDNELTLRYGLFDPGDDVCCPREFADVDFYWDGTSFVPIDPIPPADPAVRGSRR